MAEGPATLGVGSGGVIHAGTVLKEPGCDGQGAWGALGQETELCWEERSGCDRKRGDHLFLCLILL